MIDTLIVDDEAAARDGLRILVEDEPGFRVVGECGSGAEAVDAVRRLAPDLLLLDVRMPELDGFQVLEQLDAEELPAVVFVTAHDDRALDAFRVEAVDYLVKPFERRDLRRALRRVRERIRKDAARDLAERTRAVLDRVEGALGERRRYPDRIAARSGHRLRFVQTDEILWIEVVDNYVRMHVPGASHLHRSTLSEMEQRLDPAVFLRISRSLMVNLEQVVEAARGSDGRWELRLSDSTRLRSSRRYADRLAAALASRGPTDASDQRR